MSLELNKKQYKQLVRALQIAETIYALLRDMISRNKYKKPLKEIEDLASYILGFADKYGMSGVVEKFNGKNVPSEKYLDKILNDLRDYDDYAFWDELARRLARKEFLNAYSQEQIRKMSEKELIYKHFEIEDKYWEEFKKHGIDRIILKKDK